MSEDKSTPYVVAGIFFCMMVPVSGYFLVPAVFCMWKGINANSD